MRRFVRDVTETTPTTIAEVTMRSRILVGRNGTSGLESEPAIRTAVRWASACMRQFVVVVMAAARRVRQRRRAATVAWRSPTRAPTTACSEGEAGDDANDHTMSVVSGWFFPPPHR